MKSRLTFARAAKLAAMVAAPCAMGTFAAGSAAAQTAPPAPTKEFRIINNFKKGPIWAVVSTPKQHKDEWLQAILGVPAADLKTRLYGNDNVYRIYINPTTGGIPEGGEVVLTVPLYTQILPTDTGLVQDEFVNWWKGGRVGLYDVAKAIERDYRNDTANPTTPIDGASLVTCKSGCTEPLAVFQSAPDRGDLPSNDPAQLTEYTLGGIDEGGVVDGKPIGWKPGEVDYDISYVDQVYLPVAMEAVDNPFIGWIGTDQTVPKFRKGMQTFLDSPKFPGWPTYLDSDSEPFLRIPSSAILFAAESGEHPSPDFSTPGKSYEEMIRYWKGCTGVAASIPACSRIKDVEKLFAANYAQYKKDWTAAGCEGTLPKKPDVVKSLLPHVYGWVPYNETPPLAKCTKGIANPLYGTPGYTPKSYQAVQETYKVLQYETPNGIFNPYVHLVHFQPFLNMENAYAFSIDDAVGNMQTKGGGLIIAVGGVERMPNPNPFDKKKKVEVTVGAPAQGFPKWKEYGFCSPYPSEQCELNTPYPPNVISFNLETVTYPAKVVLLDSAGREYKFVITKGPPYPPAPGTHDVIQCLNLQAEWCQYLHAETITNVDPIPSVNAVIGRGTLAR